MFRTAFAMPPPPMTILARPDSRRPGIFVIAAVLEVGCDALLPLAVLAMLPALVGENRIVAVTAGVVRIRGVEPRGLVVGGVVVAEVVMLVLRPQEEMIGENAQVDHRRRRVGETGLRIRAPLKYTGANSTPRRPRE